MWACCLMTKLIHYSTHLHFLNHEVLIISLNQQTEDRPHELTEDAVMLNWWLFLFLQLGYHKSRFSLSASQWITPKSFSISDK